MADPAPASPGFPSFYSFISKAAQLRVIQRLWDEIAEPFYVIISHLVVCLLAVVMFHITSKALAFDGFGHKEFVFKITVEEWFFYLDIGSVTAILFLGVVLCLKRMWKHGHK